MGLATGLLKNIYDYMGPPLKTGKKKHWFERFAGVCALIVGVGGLQYAISFIVLKWVLLSGLAGRLCEFRKSPVSLK